MDLLPTNPDLALFTLRLALGILFLAHGPVKLFSPKEIAKKTDLSSQNVQVTGLLETLGAISLILGMWTQVGALLLIIVMLQAIYFKTRKWETTFTGNKGWQLEFIILAVALAIFLSGAGSLRLF